MERMNLSSPYMCIPAYVMKKKERKGYLYIPPFHKSALKAIELEPASRLPAHSLSPECLEQAFSTTRPIQFVLGVVACLAWQGGKYWRNQKQLQ